MKNKHCITVVGVAALCISIGFIPVKAQDLLKSGFKTPPPSAKAQTWWHWVNGNVSKTGITADLEAMKKVGIQEAQIVSADFGYPEGPATYLSPVWLDDFQFAVKEAKRLGLQIGFNNGPGWSSSGGPWVTPENAMQKVVYSEVHARGSSPFRGVLPEPPTKLDYYRDIAVIAFPTPKTDVRIDDLASKSLSGSFFRTHLDPSDKIIDGSSVTSPSKIINLTSYMSADGTLQWTPPAGNWTILRFGYTPMGTENHPTGPGGRGLEVDKMSKSALDAYWQGGVQPVLDKIKPYIGSTVVNTLIDSYEVGCNNWTKKFREAFKQRRGYDLLTYLPTLAGYYVGSGEITERFLWDFRKTVSDLMVANYYGHFRELCHQNGLQFALEPYGGPFDDLKAGQTADLVMGEFWAENSAYLETPRLAASIAHLNGQTIVGAESFTSYGGWIKHPAAIKQIGDQAWTEGINRFVFHSYVHQPWNVAPGLAFDVYGMEMNRLNTWWNQSKGFMDYVARGQFLLQQGRSFADVLLFAGEAAPNDAALCPEIKALGYDYDQIGPDQLAALSVKDGKICTPKGGTYRILLLPELKWATPALLEKIKSLIDAGALVRSLEGARPEKSPSLAGYPQCDARVAVLSKKIWTGKSFNVLSAGSLADVFKEAGLVPDFSAGETGSDLNFIHRTVGAKNGDKDGENDIYFIASPLKASRHEICRFRVTGKKPSLWNPQTGIIQDAAIWEQKADGTTEVPIDFNALGSVFVVFKKTPDLSSDHIIHARIELDHKEATPLPGLQIVKAEYGTFLPDGIADVTTAMQRYKTDSGMSFMANSGAAGFDPAPGSLKELRVSYALYGQHHEIQLLENESQFVKFSSSDNKGKDEGQFKLIRVLYGKFPPAFKEIPPKYPIYDVTERVRSIVDSDRLIFPVGDYLVSDDQLGRDPLARNTIKSLHITYKVDGEIHELSILHHQLVRLSADSPVPRIVKDQGALTWVTPYSGRLTYLTGSGKEKQIEVKNVPSPISLTGPWVINFPKNQGAPSTATLPNLMSWTKSSIDGVKYFSGTATYSKQFDMRTDNLQNGLSVELDLGNVAVIAEVILNGKNLGILWKAPFRIELGDAVKAGDNKLEVRVTNLWPNRLIGDEHLPQDVEMNGNIPAKWPLWLTKSSANTPRTSGRTTFSTYKHYNKDSKLLPSGLLGPVFIRFYRHKRLVD